MDKAPHRFVYGGSLFVWRSEDEKVYVLVKTKEKITGETMRWQLPEL